MNNLTIFPPFKECFDVRQRSSTNLLNTAIDIKINLDDKSLENHIAKNALKEIDELADKIFNLGLLLRGDNQILILSQLNRIQSDFCEQKT